jgi:hypothetical protein
MEILRAFPWLVLLVVFLGLWRTADGMPGYLESVVLFSCLVLLPRIVMAVRETAGSNDARKNDYMAGLKSLPVVFLFTTGASILYISASGYLGVGVPPPYPELGTMLSGAGRQFMMAAPWMALWPSVVLSLMIFAWVMAGDVLLERMGFRSKETWSKTME